MATDLLQTYYEWANATEIKVLDWVDPDGGWKVHPMADYPLADFASVLAICVGYILFVVFGSALMKLGIPAIKTSPIQFIYNPIQVIACSYMFMETAIQAYRNGYSPAPCNAFKADDPVMGNVLYFFYLSKMLDLCDTVFIVVGKKWRQLSFLHVYHHLSVLIIYYIVFRVAQDGDSYASVVLNGFVHTIMYTYYFVSAHTRDIWWKALLDADPAHPVRDHECAGLLHVLSPLPRYAPDDPAHLFGVRSVAVLAVRQLLRALVRPCAEEGFHC
ncbi:hypothetical protein F442_05589 [Phytophthora nicotianae P10297]|uniref:Elongation of fatty acids protein n=1 Tax=Phytophthora nicotianae P10297 TaxID=1317064 RepID=W2ZRB4_PHYNI|nr:hypothetical protein F442_05589 [Phytophthora nicotianae P10297]